MFKLHIPRIAFLLVGAVTPVAAVTISQFNITLTEDFNTLVSTGTSSVLPAGWSVFETGSAANSTYTAGTGSSATGDTYSFGATGSSDRALGMLLTSSLVSTIGTVVTNTTGGAITSLAISYTGEQWRLGSANRTDQLTFGWSADATGLGNGTWTGVNQLDFIAPNSGPTTGALDGNAIANRTTLSFAITGLNLANGSSLWLRWQDFNASGSDDGMAINDFSISAPTTVAQNTPDGLPLAAAMALFGLLALAGHLKKLSWP